MTRRTTRLDATLTHAYNTTSHAHRHKHKHRTCGATLAHMHRYADARALGIDHALGT